MQIIAEHEGWQPSLQKKTGGAQEASLSLLRSRYGYTYVSEPRASLTRGHSARLHFMRAVIPYDFLLFFRLCFADLCCCAKWPQLVNRAAGNQNDGRSAAGLALSNSTISWDSFHFASHSFGHAYCRASDRVLVVVRRRSNIGRAAAAGQPRQVLSGCFVWRCFCTGRRSPQTHNPESFQSSFIRGTLLKERR